MYRYKQKKEDVIGIALSEDNILYNTENEVINMDNNLVVLFSEPWLKEISFRNFFFINNGYYKGYFFNKKMEYQMIDGNIYTFTNNYMIYSKMN